MAFAVGEAARGSVQGFEQGVGVMVLGLWRNFVGA